MRKSYYLHTLQDKLNKTGISYRWSGVRSSLGLLPEAIKFLVLLQRPHSYTDGPGLKGCWLPKDWKLMMDWNSLKVSTVLIAKRLLLLGTTLVLRTCMDGSRSYNRDTAPCFVYFSGLLMTVNNLDPSQIFLIKISKFVVLEHGASFYRLNKDH